MCAMEWIVFEKILGNGMKLEKCAMEIVVEWIGNG